MFSGMVSQHLVSKTCSDYVFSTSLLYTAQIFVRFQVVGRICITFGMTTAIETAELGKGQHMVEGA